MRSGWAMALLGVASCVDGARPFLRTTRPAVDHGRARDVAAERARRALLPRLTAEQAASALSVEWDGGAEHVIAGALRIEARGDALTVASDAPPDDVFLYAMRAARAWVFVTKRHGLYASPTFMGRLRHLGPPTSSRDPATVVRSRGRAVVRAGELGIFSSDGASLERAPFDGVVAMAWQSEAVGAVIVRYRTIRWTADAGRTWRDVDAGGDVPLALTGTADGVFVYADGGWRRLDASGGLHVEDRAPVWRWSRRWDGAWELVEQTHENDHEFGTMGVWWDPARQRSAGSSAWDEPALRLSEHRPLGDRPRVRDAGARAMPFGATGDVELVDSRGAPVVSAARGARPARPGDEVTFAWRGVDEAGAFDRRVVASIPPEADAMATWSLVGATRTGALISGPVAPHHVDTMDGVAAPGPVFLWIDARGARRVRIADPLEAAETVALARPDGSMLVFSRRYDGIRLRPDAAAPVRGESSVDAPTSPTLVTVTAVSSEGVVGRRLRLASDPDVGWVMGLGERDGRWGIVTASRSDGPALSLHTLDGPTVPFARWAWGASDPPAVPCGPASVHAARLHVFGWGERGAWGRMTGLYGPPFHINIGVGRNPYVRGYAATLEFAGEGAAQGPCVRDVDTVRDDRPATGVAHLSAHDGRLEGIYDDGRSLTPVSIGLRAPSDDPGH